jgi:FixJ family two-component response regulator
MTPTPVVATVDDDRRVRESIHSVLESAGYDAVMFESAEDLLESGLLPRLGCVIVDVRLPGLNGVDLQHRIRQQRPSMPVIFVTAHDDDGIRTRALRGGAVAFMLKPFDAAALLETVERATRTSDD